MTTTTDLEPISPAALAPVTPPDTDSWAAVVGQVAKLAAHIADTDFVPRGLRGSSAAVTAAILYGREIGLPPMTALTQVHVVEGRPALSAEGMRALILASGHDLEIRAATGAVATVAGRRRGSGRWAEVTWNLDMAKAAGLIKPNGNWARYPRAMLVARATVELARQLFPDVIHGFRAAEELADETTPDTAALDPAPTPAGPTVRRATKRARKAATPPVDQTPTGAAADPPPPPLPGEPGHPETPATGGVAPHLSPPVAGPEPEPEPPPAELEPEVAEPEPEPEVAAPAPELEPGPVEPEPEAEPDAEVEVVEPEPEPPARGIDVQAVRLRFEKGLGVTDRDARLAYTSAIIGRELTSSTHLTRRESALVLDTLGMCQTTDDLDNAVTATLDYRAEHPTPTPEG